MRKSIDRAKTPIILKIHHYRHLFPNHFLALCLFSLALGCNSKSSETAEQQNTTPPNEAVSTSTTETTKKATSTASDEKSNDNFVEASVPDWIADAVFYQIFPERFRNGDSNNDPIRESLEYNNNVPKSWRISSWTSDWYSRDDWERELGPNFYDHGVFHRRYGGDLQGVIDKLDYLEDLGINTIYFNPVFYAASLHKYDGTSMHHIDPYFGPDPQGDLEIIAKETADPSTWEWTSADKLFLELVEKLHQRNMRVIIDGVFNHTGRDFFAFKDIIEKQNESEYQDWYIVQKFDDPGTPFSEFHYKSWWGHESLPEFSNNSQGDDLHPKPKAYLMNITRRWMDPNRDGDPTDGIDGWRLDVANEVPMGFWKDWNTLVRDLNPQAYTVGEFWDNARDQLIDGQFSATMNYHNFAFLVKGFLVDGTLTPHDFGMLLTKRLAEFPQPMQYALQNLIDSHDTDRVASMIVNAGRASYKQPDRFDYDVSERNSPRNWKDFDLRKPDERERKIQRLVAFMQMTFVGPPMIYYGTEAGMWGADDPCDRMPMVWQDLTYDLQTGDPRNIDRKPDTIAFDQKLFDYYQRAIVLRKESPTLCRGNFEPVANDDSAKFFAFSRKLGDESLLIAINRGEEEYSWQLSDQQATGINSLFRTSDDSTDLKITQEGDDCLISLPPLEGALFAIEPNEE